MGFKLGQEIIDRIRCKKRSYERTHTGKSLVYGKIYYPNYNLDFALSNKDSNLYNEFGENLKIYFIRDAISAHEPIRSSRYFLFDRYNFGLDTHFYSHEKMLETMGNPKHRFGMFVESEAIVPKTYRLFDKHKGLEKDFDLIFTYSAKILDNIENARFVPFCARPWNQNDIDESRYTKKTKNVSILSSDKLWTPLHKYRYDLAIKCKQEGLADTFGTFDGGSTVQMSETLNDYRYTFAIENDITPYFFTERLTSAFVSQTVPIYIGATEIDKFFNPDGIIKISTKDDITKVLKNCNEEDYNNRLPAIKENFEKVKEYFNTDDFMYKKYLEPMGV